MTVLQNLPSCAGALSFALTHRIGFTEGKVERDKSSPKSPPVYAVYLGLVRIALLPSVETIRYFWQKLKPSYFPGMTKKKAPKGSF